MCGEERLEAGPLRAVEEAEQGLVGFADVVVDVDEDLVVGTLAQPVGGGGRDRDAVADAPHLEQHVAVLAAFEQSAAQ